MSVTASHLSASLDPTTHVCTVSGVQTFPDGSQRPLSITLPGNKYDATVALIGVFVNPTQLQNGAGGPVTLDDVARFWAEMYNLLNLPAAPPAAATPQTAAPADISV